MAEDPLVRVLVADGDEQVQTRFVGMLAAMPDVAVQVPVATPRQLAQRLRAGSADVVLVAEQLAGANGLSLCSQLGLSYPDVKLVFTAFDPPGDMVVLAIHAGAAGVVVRERGPADAAWRGTDISAELLENAIRAVRTGEVYLDPRVAGWVIGAAGDAFSDPPDSNGQL